MQRHRRTAREHAVPKSVFQSSPDPEAGCNATDVRPSWGKCSTFQSSPDPEAGCNVTQPDALNLGPA